MIKTFTAVIPLSNWLLGYDRYQQIFDKSQIPHNKFPGVFYVVEAINHEEVEHVRLKTHALLERLNIQGNRLVCLESCLEVGAGKAEQNSFTGTGIGWRWPSSVLPISRVGWMAENGTVEWVSHEHITAEAYQLNIPGLHSWEECQPRSFSVLPIALACNASCAFCFSKASISASVIPQKLDRKNIEYWARKGAELGAKRAVITGGGEPTILPYPQLLELTGILGESFPSVLLINNGSMIEKWMNKDIEDAKEKMLALKKAGLTRIAFSRHGIDSEMDQKILGIRVDAQKAARWVQELGIQVRYICLLQKAGVNGPERIKQYLERSALEGITEVCFKELYVSSLSENPKSPSQENLYCMENQIPLSVLITTLENLNFTAADALPWGSPVYVGEIQGVKMKIAAYTEPSVGWERKHGVVRSWNLTSDGDCLASLEDPNSFLTQT